MVGMKHEEAKHKAKAALQQMITAARQYLRAEEIFLGDSTDSRERKRKNKVRERRLLRSGSSRMAAAKKPKADAR